MRIALPDGSKLEIAEDGASIEVILKNLGINPEEVIVAKNGKIVSEDWELLEVLLNKAYDDFTLRLKKLYPVISDTELKVCMLTKIGVPANQIMAKEIDLRGSVQYHKAFPEVMALLAAGRLKIDDLITHRFPFAEAPAAFAFALDRRDSIKILVDLPRDNMETASS